MAIGTTARRLAALTLTLGAVWLWAARAEADSANYDDAGTDALVTELPDVIRNYSGVVEDYSGKTVILHSNDTMGAVEGFPRIAWLKREFERRGAETILVDAGNFSMSAIYVSSKGADAVELMNLTGYDVAGLGRFEFTYGYDAMKINLRRAAFPILCANAVENGENLCVPNYSYTTKSGLTIGFFGLLSPKTEANLNLTNEHEIEIYKRRDIYKCAQAQIDALRQPGSVIPAADLVIALSSLGAEDEHSAIGYSSLNVFNKTEGLDLILDGGSESEILVEGVQSCGENFNRIGVVVIDDATKSIEDRYLIETETLESDETVLQAVKTMQGRYQAGYGAIFVRTEAELNGESAPGNRTEETNLGDLISDALVWMARRELKDDETPMIGLMNGGSIRASIAEGYITRNYIDMAFPFPDTLSVVYVTGAELLEVLEAATWCLPDSPSNSYPQTSGVVFTLDERAPFDAGDFYPNSRFYRPASVRRVRIHSVCGQPFDPDALYAVATNSYCAGGSGTFYLFGAAKRRYDSATSIEQAITDYIRLGLGGVVTEAAYGKPKGNHTILS